MRQSRKGRREVKLRLAVAHDVEIVPLHHPTAHHVTIDFVWRMTAVMGMDSCQGNEGSYKSGLTNQINQENNSLLKPATWTSRQLPCWLGYVPAEALLIV